MKNEIAEIIDTLEHVSNDQSERYVMTVTDMYGTRNRIINRQEYLEFTLNCAIDSLCGVLAEEE